MPEAVYNAHIYFYVEAQEDARENEPPTSPQSLVIRRGFDLGAYSLDQFSGLLEGLEERLEEWVGQNPPAGGGE